MNKELKSQLEALHLEDYEGGSWGAATSHPYRVKKWLSKSLSDRLLADAYTEYDRAKAVFDSIPASKRVVHNATMLCPELRRWYDIGCQAALPTKVEGHVVCLACVDQVCYKNSYHRYKAELRARDAEALCFVVNGNDSGYPSYSRLMKWMIYWDAEIQRFYRLEWRRASTGPVPESARRRNWARGAKRKEFLAECKKLQAKLLEEGIEIASLVKDGGRWHDQVYVDCYDPAEIPDPQAAEPAPGPSVSAPAEPAPAPAAPASGVTVCFTGALSITRLEASNVAKAAGMGVVSSVGKGTTYLVTNTPDSGSAKNRKARELGVTVLNESEFMAMAELMKPAA